MYGRAWMLYSAIVAVCVYVGYAALVVLGVAPAPVLTPTSQPSDASTLAIAMLGVGILGAGYITFVSQSRLLIRGSWMFVGAGFLLVVASSHLDAS